MSGPISPWYSPGGGNGIAGSRSAGWTLTKTAEAGVAETIATFKVSDGTGQVTVENASSTDTVFSPRIRGVGQSTGVGLNITAQGVTDTGSNGVMQLVSRIGAATLITTRPLFSFLNHSTEVLSLIPLNSGANSALSWGTQTGAAPAFTTRSAGTRLILYSAISGTKVDNAIGVSASGAANTYSVQEATSSYAHDFYAGTTKIAYLRGDGFSVLTGGEIHKVRVATTTPVTCTSGADRYVVTKLAAPAAVAVTLPTAVTGQVITIQDGTGDAAANNITISPVSGTINGAATLVINTNFGCKELFYDGATWLAR